MGVPDNRELQVRWRAYLASGSPRSSRALVRALEEDPGILEVVVPLAFDPADAVRLATLRALGVFSSLRPDAIAPYMPAILDAAAAATLRGAKEPAVAEAPHTGAAAGADAQATELRTSAIGSSAHPPFRRPHEEAALSGDAPALLYATIAEMFEVLLNVGWTRDILESDDPFRGWKALPLETMEDVLEGVVYLLEVVHRDGRHDRPWSPDEVFEILLKRALPSILPLRVRRATTQTALVEVAAPLTSPPDGVDPDTWIAAVPPFVKLLGHFVHPGFNFQPADPARGLAIGKGEARFIATTAETAPSVSR